MFLLYRQYYSVLCRPTTFDSFPSPCIADTKNSPSETHTTARDPARLGHCMSTPVHRGGGGGGLLTLGKRRGVEKQYRDNMPVIRDYPLSGVGSWRKSGPVLLKAFFFFTFLNKRDCPQRWMHRFIDKQGDTKTCRQTPHGGKIKEAKAKAKAKAIAKAVTMLSLSYTLFPRKQGEETQSTKSPVPCL